MGLRMRLWGKASDSLITRLASTMVKPYPYNTVVYETDITVDTTGATVLNVPSNNGAVIVWWRNISTGGQLIRIGNVPTFTVPCAGWLLQPGESWGPIEVGAWQGTAPQLASAVASANGALLNVMEMYMVL